MIGRWPNGGNGGKKKNEWIFLVDVLNHLYSRYSQICHGFELTYQIPPPHRVFHVWLDKLFLPPKACAHSREWQALIQSITAILCSWEASNSVCWSVYEGDLFCSRKKKNQINTRIWTLCFWFSLEQNLVKITHHFPHLPLVGQIASMPLLISTFLFFPRGGSRVEIVWVDDEWFLSLQCLFAWGRYQLHVFHILETYWSA